MGVILTPEGKDLIARLQAEGTPLIIDAFLFGYIAAPVGTAPPTTNAPDAIVHSAPIPPEYRGYINPAQVVYSAFLGSDVGDFDYNWQGLFCTEHNVVVAASTFPRLEKRKYDESTNTPGNNVTRNFMLEFSDAQDLTQITVEAGVWQLDFTVRLKGIDERERLSNFDVYGNAAFIGDAWLVTGAAGVYNFATGAGYVGGIRAALYDAMTVPVESYPCDVWLDVSMPRQGSDVVTDVTPLFLAENAWEGEYHTYTDASPYSLPHYAAKIAHIDDLGNVTDLRKKYSVLPEGAQEGQGLVFRNGLWTPGLPYKIGSFHWSDDGELEPGMVPALANWVEDFDRYVDAVRYFESPAGQARLVSSLEEYEALHNSITYTYPDGSVERWNGKGGVTNFFWDKINNRMKMPDLWDMFRGAIGDARPDVGGVHGDGIRQIPGAVQNVYINGSATGAFYTLTTGPGLASEGTTGRTRGFGFDPSRVVPVAAKNQPRAWGALPCVYLGLPAS